MVSSFAGDRMSRSLFQKTSRTNSLKGEGRAQVPSWTCVVRIRDRPASSAAGRSRVEALRPNPADSRITSERRPQHASRRCRPLDSQRNVGYRLLFDRPSDLGKSQELGLGRTPTSTLCPDSRYER